MRILGVIPARGGSKSIFKKNMSDLNGKPLIHYSIKEALKSKFLTELIVSSDDKEIIEYSKNNGATVPFIRPKEISTDNALSASVVIHALEFMENFSKKRYDFVMMLQPTSPFRKSKHIDECISMAKSNECDSIVSIVNVDGYHPFRMKRLEGKKLINYIDQGFEDMRPRQKLPNVYIRNGSIYLIKRDVLVKEKTLVGKQCIGYEMNSYDSVNIDNKLDLLVARAIIES